MRLGFDSFRSTLWKAFKGSAMNQYEQFRLDCLINGPCVPEGYIREYYGLAWPFEGELREDFDIWLSQLRRRTGCSAGNVSRYELEAFIQQKRLVPSKWMAARLGMTARSFDEVLPRLSTVGLRQQRYVVYPGLIAESLSEDVVPAFPELKFRTFGSHNSFCDRLHEVIHSTLGIEVVKLYCATSTIMADDPRWYANNFDCITLQPLCGKHQMWLDFGKPLSLGPDRCSKLFYFENHDQLHSYFAGTNEPDDRAVYEPLIERRRSGN